MFLKVPAAFLYNIYLESRIHFYTKDCGETTSWDWEGYNKTRVDHYSYVRL